MGKVKGMLIHFSIAIMIAVKNFQTKSGCKITIKVCPEIFNHDPIENFSSVEILEGN
jgi:hypothetical protein